MSSEAAAAVTELTKDDHRVTKLWLWTKRHIFFLEISLPSGFWFVKKIVWVEIDCQLLFSRSLISLAPGRVVRGVCANFHSWLESWEPGFESWLDVMLSGGKWYWNFKYPCAALKVASLALILKVKLMYHFMVSGTVVGGNSYIRLDWVWISTASAIYGGKISSQQCNSAYTKAPLLCFLSSNKTWIVLHDQNFFRRYNKNELGARKVFFAAVKKNEIWLKLKKTPSWNEMPEAFLQLFTINFRSLKKAQLKSK